jgi:hypothetical protein
VYPLLAEQVQEDQQQVEVDFFQVHAFSPSISRAPSHFRAASSPNEYSRVVR